MMANGYADAMNVPSMIRLFRSISFWKSLSPDDFGSSASQVKRIWGELCLLSHYAPLIISILTEKQDLSVFL